MKMLFVCFFALVITASAFAQGSYTATGAVKNQVKEFGSFVNSASSALTVGMVVCLDNTAADGIAVDFCAGEGFKPVGIVTDTSCAVGARCKIQTKGYFAYGKFDYLATATVAGGMVYADVDGDIVRPATVLVSHAPIGTSFAAVAADSAVLKIFIDL